MSLKILLCKIDKVAVYFMTWHHLIHFFRSSQWEMFFKTAILQLCEKYLWKRSIFSKIAGFGPVNLLAVNYFTFILFRILMKNPPGKNVEHLVL